MRRGEKLVFAIMATVVVVVMAKNIFTIETQKQPDKGIPFYTTASQQLTKEASEIYRVQGCRQCHSLWTVKNMLETIPAPALDGIGSIRTEEWFYNYFSAKNPQAILPSRLKKEYSMPSYASLPEHDRRVLAQYMASLKVKDWYLEDTKKMEYEKLTGKTYKGQ
ncbi:MAG: c-type cytochrome [Betaproteobacteria bacterium]|nr:c-type cytochrome [Betaproteobacteria bacterium]MDE2423114.1 c-type cytochrome [Betaproteobacteria bacterium]